MFKEDKRQYITVEIEHCSEYILTETKISENEISTESNESNKDDVQDVRDDEVQGNTQKSPKKVGLIIGGIVLVIGGIILIAFNRNKILEKIRRK